MAILTGILQFVLVIVCILLVGVILLQRNKGAGAGVTFGGGEAVFGADMGNVLTRSTIVLGVLFLSITIALSIITAHASKGGSGSVTDSLAPAPAAPALPAAAETAPAEADAAAAEALADEAADAAEPAAEAVAEPAAETAEAAPVAEPAAEPAAETAEAAAPAADAPASATPAPAAE